MKKKRLNKFKIAALNEKSTKVYGGTATSPPKPPTCVETSKIYVPIDPN